MPAMGLPPGVSDDSLLREARRNERSLVIKIKRWFDQATRANDEWRADAIESLKFVSGEQWSDDDLERLQKQRRPALVINKILPRVLFLGGMFRQTREEPKILPMESQDVKSSTIIGALYKWVATKVREKKVDARVFDYKQITGLGYWKAGVSFEFDPTGDVLLEAANPLSIFPDPNWLDNGWDNAEYVIDAKWMTLENAIEEFPDHEQEIRSQFGEWLAEFTSSSRSAAGAGEFAGDSFSDERNFWDPETQRLRVLECWYRLRVKMTVAINMQTQEVTAEPARVKFLQEQVQREPELGREIRFVRRKVARVRVARILNDILLADDASPYKQQVFPIFPTTGFYWWRRPFGIVTPLKDPQREKNKRRSTVVEMVMRASLSGFFNDETRGAKTRDLEQYASGVAKVINHKGAQPTPIQPPELPQTLVFLDTQSDRDMDTISNINAELLGISTQRTISGRAIRARQQSGMVVQEPMLESMIEDKEPVTRFVIGLIQQFMPVFKALRILGSEISRQPGTEIDQQLSGLTVVDLQRALSAAFSTKFDVVIGSKPFEPSLQQQKFTVLSELAQEFGGFIPPKVLIEQGVKAGIVDEQQGLEILQFVQQQLEAQAAQQAAATAGAAPAPPASPLLGQVA